MFKLELFIKRLKRTIKTIVRKLRIPKRKGYLRSSKRTMWLFNIPTILEWLIKGENLVISNSEVRAISSLIQKLLNISVCSGPSEAIKFTKSTRQALMNYLSGSSERVPGVKVTKDGIPVDLGDLIPRVRGLEEAQCNYVILSLLNSILFSTRHLVEKAKLDLDSITEDPRLETAVLHDMKPYLKGFLRQLGIRPFTEVPKSLRWSKFHFTSKTGPNGHGLKTCYIDLNSLPDKLYESICTVGGPLLQEKMSILRDNPQHLTALGYDCSKNGKVRRLAYFPDKEGKTRVVAILDYWSQASLKPLHTFLFKVLKRIPQDRTFSQGDFSLLSKSEMFYSIDLSAATDRFPIAIIEMILKSFLPDQYVDNWSNIMVGFPFSVDNKSVFYSCGNPMGAYSSWSSFTLAHHFIVYYCIKKLGMSWKKTPYYLLGDDLCLGDDKLGKRYLDLLSSLGVEYSPLKTHVSKDFYEVAKRYFHKGKEITPFPLSALPNSSKRYYTLFELIVQQQARGWKMYSSRSLAIMQYYKHVKRISRKKFLDDIVDKVYKLDLVYQITSGSLSVTDGLNAYLLQLGLHAPNLETYYANALWSQAMKELLVRSLPSSSKGKPLGDMAVSYVMYLTDFDIAGESGLALIYAMPQLQIYGQFEDVYRRANWEVKDFYESPEWDLVISMSSIPYSDEIFFLRKSTQNMVTSTVLCKVLDGILKANFYQLSTEGVGD